METFSEDLSKVSYDFTVSAFFANYLFISFSHCPPKAEFWYSLKFADNFFLGGAGEGVWSDAFY